jgi:hypothetical protein
MRAVLRTTTSGLVGLVACAALAVEGRAEEKAYGSGVSPRPAVSIGALLEQPRAFVGQTVRVEGVVTAVCQHMGCWLEITDPEIGRGVRFKVQDGVIVFPRDAAGRRASAEGVFEEIASSPVRGAHGGDARAAEASGVPDAGQPTETLYWVRARGAVLHD